jgi:DNA-binding transcriptional LysR family regulator
MDRLLSTEAFVRVAQTGSFAKAAEQLGVTRSVITHRVQQLESFINSARRTFRSAPTWLPAFTA